MTTAEFTRGVLGTETFSSVGAATLAPGVVSLQELIVAELAKTKDDLPDVG